jgi:hypothetical protein
MGREERSGEWRVTGGGLEEDVEKVESGGRGSRGRESKKIFYKDSAFTE